MVWSGVHTYGYALPMSSPDSANPAAAAWHQIADDLSRELAADVTWTPVGFQIHGYIASSPDAVRAIASLK